MTVWVYHNLTVTLSSLIGKFKFLKLNDFIILRNYSWLRLNWTEWYTHTHTHTHTYIYIYIYNLKYLKIMNQITESWHIRRSAEKFIDTPRYSSGTWQNEIYFFNIIPFSVNTHIPSVLHWPQKSSTAAMTSSYELFI